MKLSGYCNFYHAYQDLDIAVNTWMYFAPGHHSSTGLLAGCVLVAYSLLSLIGRISSSSASLFFLCSYSLFITVATCHLNFLTFLTYPISSFYRYLTSLVCLFTLCRLVFYHNIPIYFYVSLFAAFSCLSSILTLRRNQSYALFDIAGCRFSSSCTPILTFRRFFPLFYCMS